MYLNVLKLGTYMNISIIIYMSIFCCWLCTSFSLGLSSQLTSMWFRGFKTPILHLFHWNAELFFKELWLTGTEKSDKQKKWDCRLTLRLAHNSFYRQRCPKIQQKQSNCIPFFNQTWYRRSSISRLFSFLLNYQLRLPFIRRWFPIVEGYFPLPAYHHLYRFI